MDHFRAICELRGSVSEEELIWLRTAKQRKNILPIIAASAAASSQLARHMVRQSDQVSVAARFATLCESTLRWVPESRVTAKAALVVLREASSQSPATPDRQVPSSHVASSQPCRGKQDAEVQTEALGQEEMCPPEVVRQCGLCRCTGACGSRQCTTRANQKRRAPAARVCEALAVACSQRCGRCTCERDGCAKPRYLMYFVYRRGHVCFVLEYRTKTNKQANTQTNKQTNKQANTQTNRQTDRQTDRQTNKQTSKHTYKKQASKQTHNVFSSLCTVCVLLFPRFGRRWCSKHFDDVEEGPRRAKGFWCRTGFHAYSVIWDTELRLAGRLGFLVPALLPYDWEVWARACVTLAGPPQAGSQIPPHAIAVLFFRARVEVAPGHCPLRPAVAVPVSGVQPAPGFQPAAQDYRRGNHYALTSDLGVVVW